MDVKRFEEILKQLQDKENQILIDRAKRYSLNGDRLHNFKQIANLLNIHPAQACLNLMLKHFIALCSYVSQLSFRNTSAVNLHLVEEYIVDLRNYLALLWAIFNEGKEEE